MRIVGRAEHDVDSISPTDTRAKLTNIADKPLWITEAGSVAGGGVKALSRKFVAALGYADMLALAAKLGVSLVARQSLFGENDRLFDIDKKRAPESPEYWISYLFKELNGSDSL